MSSAVMPVLKELLIEVLRLPAGTELMRIDVSLDGRTFYFAVSHPDIPDGVAYVVPSFRKKLAENGKEEIIEFIEWNPK